MFGEFGGSQPPRERSEWVARVYGQFSGQKKVLNFFPLLALCFSSFRISTSKIGLSDGIFFARNGFVRYQKENPQNMYSRLSHEDAQPEQRRWRDLPALLVGIALIVTLSGCVGGSSVSQSTAVVSGFPSEQVPLAPGDVTDSSKTGAIWNVTVAVADTGAQSDALQSLKDKGFVVIGSSGTSDANRVYSLATGDHLVRLSYGTLDNRPTVTYGVSTRDNSGK